MSQRHISEFCTSQLVEWKFIPKTSQNFVHLSFSSGNSYLRQHLFLEGSIVPTQIKACLNSRSLPCDSDRVEVLTPGHFLIGRPIESIPDPSSFTIQYHFCTDGNYASVSSDTSGSDGARNISKSMSSGRPMKNPTIGDVVVLHDDKLFPTKWSLGKVLKLLARMAWFALLNWRHNLEYSGDLLTRLCYSYLTSIMRY